MHKIHMFLVLLLLSAVCFAAESIPAFRKTAEVPFSNGRRIEKIWRQADTFSTFVTCRDYNAAEYQTWGQGLYDENCLYLSVTAAHDSKYRQSDARQSLFANNNFEIFIQPDPEKSYIQIALDDLGRVFTAYGRTAGAIPGLKTWVSRTPASWTANLAIPFAAMKVRAPEADTRIKFCVMRNNISFYGKDPEVSAYAPMAWNYHVPSMWADVLMTARAGSPRNVPGPANGIRLNLMQNSEFNRPENWNGKFVQHTETMAMSGEWIVRACGDVYHFLNLRPLDFQPDTDYTLVVKARHFGDEGNMRILQMERTPDGKVREGVYIAMNLSLSSEFHEYYLPFRTGKNAPWSIIFYKLGAKNTGCGVELASVKCHRGHISQFEIRRLSRAGVNKPLPETAPAVPPCFYGRRPDGMKVLALVSYVQLSRDPMELFAGTGIQCDILSVTGKAQDIYQTDGVPGEIEKRLKSGEYDLYMVGSNVAPSLGKGLCRMIGENVKKGAGLWYGYNRDGGLLKPLMTAANTRETDGKHYLRQSFPAGMFRQQDSPGVAERIKIGQYGKGKVVQLFAPRYYQNFKIQMKKEDYGVVEFPYARYTDAWLVRLACYAAGRTGIRIDRMALRDNAISLKLNRLPRQNSLSWEIADRNGEKIDAGRISLKKAESVLPIPGIHHSGRMILTAHLLDQNDRVLDYALSEFEIAGPALENLATDRDSYLSSETAGVTVRVRNCLPGLALNWQLLDFSDRILDQGSLPAQKENRFSLTFASMFTNMGRICVTLEKNHRQVDRIYAPVYVRDLDFKRLYYDYTPAIWPAGNSTMENEKSIGVQLEKIGIRHYILPLHGAPVALKAGFGLGNDFLGGGDTFCGWPQKDNIRRQQFNTAKTRAEFARRAERITSASRRYGMIHSCVCDEPNLARPGTADELDAHPENLAVYRKRMERKYGTIGEYNRRHLTSHKSFADVDQALIRDARKSGKYAEFIEWRNFNVDRWCEIIKILADNGRKGDPASRLSLYNSFGQGAFSGNDYWKLLTKSGLDFSMEYTSMVYFGRSPIFNFDEFYRSFRPDMRVWGFTGYFYTPERAVFMPWWFAAHRYGGFTWFAAYSWGYNMVDIPTNAMTVNARNIQNSLDRSNLLRGVGKITLDFPWRSNDAAIYYSHDSMLLAFALGKETKNGEIQESGPLHDYFYSRQGMQYTLEELLWQYEFVAPEQIIGNKLDSYRILFMPAIIALSDQEVKSLKQFLARGGRIVADTMPGVYDELGVKRSRPPFSSDEIILTGRIFNEQDMSLRRLVLDQLKKAGSAPVLFCDNALESHGREAMHFTSDGMNVYMILRMLGRSTDKDEQTFRFPSKGHLYDLRAQKYLGETDVVTTRVPYGDAAVFGHYPYRIEKVALRTPDSVRAGEDLTAHIAVVPARRGLFRQKPRRHVFHIEVLDPDRKGRFHMKRNVSAPEGEYDLVFRMAHNDRKGTWTLKVTDAMSGTVAERPFVLK